MDILHIYFLYPLVVLGWKGYDFNDHFIFFVKKKIGVF